MATHSGLQFTSCKASLASAASTLELRGTARKQVCCTGRPSGGPSCFLSRGKVPSKQTCGAAATGSLLGSVWSGRARAASQAYELSLEQTVEPSNSPEQIRAAQDTLKDVAEASQLGFEDVVSDAKERAADVVEGTQDFFSQSGEAAKGFLEDAQERLKEKLPMASKVGDASQDIVDGAEERVGSAAQDTLKDVAEASQLSLEDVVSDAKERAGDIVGGTQDFFSQSGEAAKGFLENAQESFNGLMEKLPMGPKVGDASQGLVDGAEERVNELAGTLPAPNVENAIQSVEPGAQVRAEDAGNALQDFFANTQDRLESAQDAMKAFLSKPAEKAESQVPEAATPAPAESLSGLKASDAVETAQKTVESVEGSAASLVERAAPGAVEGAQNQAPSVPEEALSSSISSFKESATDPATAGQDTVSEVVDNAAEALETGRAAINDVLQDAQEKLNSTLGGATSSLQNSISSTKNGVLGAVQSAQDAFHDFFDTASKSVSGATSAVNDQTNSIVTSLREIGTPLKGAVNQASSLAADTVSRISQEVGAVLPPEAREALTTAKRTAGELSGPLQGFLKQAGNVAGDLLVSAERAAGFNPNDPAVTAVLVGGGVAALVVTWWVREKAGYGGDLSPQEALELLQKERRTVLVDVRPQKLRDANGIPALKRGARFKFASVDPVTLDRDLRRLVRDASAVENQILAARIRGLKLVGSGTTVVVMDDRGQTSKDVARAVARTDVKKAYRLDGGYSAWAASLATRDDAPEAPVAILKEEAALIAEDTGVPAPLLVTGLSSGAVVATWAVINWERTLQLIALWGIASSIYSRAKTYTSLEDAKADLRLLQQPFQLGASVVGGVFGQVSKAAGSPQLAASKGTSAESASQQPASNEDEFDDPAVVEKESVESAPRPVSRAAVESE